MIIKCVKESGNQGIMGLRHKLLLWWLSFIKYKPHVNPRDFRGQWIALLVQGLCKYFTLDPSSIVVLCLVLRPSPSCSWSGFLRAASLDLNLSSSCSGSGTLNSNISFRCSKSRRIWVATSASFSFSGSGTLNSNISFRCFKSGCIWAAASASKSCYR